MGRNSAKTPIKCRFLAFFLPYTPSWGKTPKNGLKWAFLGPFWPPGAPPGGGPPPDQPGGAKIPPPEGGGPPWTPLGPPRGGVEIWPASPFFIGNLQGPGWQTKGAPLDCHFLALLTPPRGGSPPLQRPPRAPQIHPPGGSTPPLRRPSGPPFWPVQAPHGRICRHLIGKFLRVCQDFPGVLIGSTGVLACISPLGGGSFPD